MRGGKRKGAGRKKGSVTSKNKWKKICTKLSPESIKKLDSIVKESNKMKCDVIDDAVKQYFFNFRIYNCSECYADIQFKLHYFIDKETVLCASCYMEQSKKCKLTCVSTPFNPEL